MTIPMFARKFAVDFVETALATVFALTLAFPTSVGDLKGVGVSIGVGVLGAAISAARRAIPGFLSWFRTALAVPAEDTTPVETPAPADGSDAT